jgi:hypothetical protein
MILINTDIPKAKVFRFENFWLLREEFLPVMQHGWNVPVFQQDHAKKISAKFKNLHRVLKMWHYQLFKLSSIIENNKLMLSFMDVLEETRDLSLQEWNFRLLVQENLDKWLEQQRVYWKQRGNIKWAKLDDENTKFFHVNATIRHNKSTIQSLKDHNGA